MNIVDLHTHSTCSDGTFTPTELVAYAKEKGLSAVALTDHDTFDGVEEAKQAGKTYNIEVIGGIEFSTKFESTEVHIVGLFLDNNCDIITNRLEDLQLKRNQRNYKVAKLLKELNMDISYKDFEECAEGGIITRAHIAKALVKKGYCQSNKECFDRFLGVGKPAYVEREVLYYDEILKLIKMSGGISVLAHPLLYKLSNARLENIVGIMAEKGLNAIEAYYSTHSQADTKYIKIIAQKNRLMLSGGSDFHGKNKPNLDLATGYGSLAVPEEILTIMKGNLKWAKTQ